MNKYCPECGNKTQATKFCGECGYSFFGTESTANKNNTTNTTQNHDIDYSSINFSYKTAVDNYAPKKFGEVAQESKTGFSRGGGKYSKIAGQEFLNQIKRKTEIGGGDDE